MPKNLELGISLNTKGLEQGLSKAKAQFNSFSSSLSSIASKLPAGLSGASTGVIALTASIGLAATAAIATTAALYKMASSVATMADELDENAQKLGLTIEFYQKLQSASEKTGISIDAFKSSMRTLTNTAYEASQGNEKFAKTYKELGVSVTDSSGKLKNQEQLLSEVLLSLSSMEQGTRRTALSIDVLGKAGGELAPLLNQGTDAVKRYITENESAVLVSQRLVDASSQYKDRMQELNEEVTKARNEALEPLVETLLGVANGLLAIVRSEGVQTFFDGLTISAQKFSDALDPVLFNLGILSNPINNNALKGIEEVSKQIYETETKMYELREKGKSNTQQYLDLMNKLENLEKTRTGWQKEWQANQKKQNEINEAAAEKEKAASEEASNAAKAKAAADAARIKAQADYNALLEKGMGIAEASREAILSETLGGRVALIEEETQKRIDAINLLKNADIEKEEAIRLLRLDTEERIKEERNKQAREDYAAHLELQRKREESENRVLGLRSSNYDIASKLEEARSKTGLTYRTERSSTKTSITGLQSGKVEYQTVPTVVSYTPAAYRNKLSKQALAEEEIISGIWGELRGYREEVLELSKADKEASLEEVNANNKRIGQYQELIRLNLKLLGDSSGGVSQQVKLEAARRTTKNPTWMALRDDNGVKMGWQPSYGEKLAEQWGGTSFGDKAQLITEQATQMYSTINDAAQMAFEATIAREQAEIDMTKKKEYAKIDGMVISNRRAKQLREKADSEAEVASKDLQKRQMRMQLSSLWSSTAVGIAGAWAQAFATNAPAWAPIVAGISTAALLANAGIQSSAINKNMESLATGGVIGGFNGASMGPDDRSAIVREGEMILNARQQRNLFKAITNDSVGGGGITVNIDKFTGGDDELSRLKDMLVVLKSNGQLAF